MKQAWMRQLCCLIPWKYDRKDEKYILTPKIRRQNPNVFCDIERKVLSCMVVDMEFVPKKAS